MNCQKVLFSLISERKWQAIETLKHFHVFPIWRYRQLPFSLVKNRCAETSLFLTTLPANKRVKKSRLKIDKVPVGPLLISCRNSKLNHHQGMHYGTFDQVPLASKGWRSRKSKGDHFTILPTFEHPAFTSSKATELPKTFQELGINDTIIQELHKMGIYNPTVIQAKSIQKFLQGQNLLITAETGCGKTLAYVIPIMDNILKLRDTLPLELNAPFGIILVPSKELALQVGNTVTTLGSGLGLHCVTLISGDFKNIVKAPSIEITDIIVTTLGIMMRYMKSKIYSMKRCTHLVLDEADMFFEQDFIFDLQNFLHMAKVRAVNAGHARCKILIDCEMCVVSKLRLTGLHGQQVYPDSAQLCLTSATTLRRSTLDCHGLIPTENLEVVTTGYVHKVLLHIRQHFMRLNKSEKPEVLLGIIKKNVKKQISTIIYSNKTATSHFIHLFLERNGLQSTIVNADMFSEERIRGLISFKEQKVFVLVCTDCMSRGLDMPWVKEIINYDFPNNMASYIHRCGRTGRLGHDENCLVTNLVSGKNEIKFVNEIEMAVRCGRELTLNVPRDVEVKGRKKGRKSR